MYKKPLYLLLALLIITATPLALVAAQGGDPDTLIYGLNGDLDHFNPVTQTLANASIVQSVMLPILYDVDPMTGLPVPGLSSWEVSEDGLTYTFTIRDDANWSDGTPISSEDVRFTYESVLSENVQTARTRIYGWLDRIEVVDDKTFRLILKQPFCELWGDLTTRLMPAHRFAPDYSDFMTSDWNTAPDISGGPYVFEEWRPDELVRLRANPNWWKGEPKIPNLIYRVIVDPVVMQQSLITGDIDYAFVTATTAEDLASYDHLRQFPFGTNGFVKLFMNWADPANPVNGYDENGNLNDQGHHPLFADPRVREAVALGWDKDAVIATMGAGAARLPGTVTPVITWAFNNNLGPRPYDPEAAMALLEEAGWTDQDGDGIRECHGCMYAEEGTPLEFQLDYILGGYGGVADAAALLAQDGLNQIGFRVNLRSYEFSAMYDERVRPQTFDAFIGRLTWGSPDPYVLTNLALNSQQDVLGTGFNNSSYINPEMDRLLQIAGSTPGCDTQTRADALYEIQRITYEEVVYDMIAMLNGVHVMNARVANFEPGPWNAFWNIEQLEIAP